MAQKPITALIRGVRQYNHNCSLINALEKQNAQTKFQGFKVFKWGGWFHLAYLLQSGSGEAQHI